MFTYEEMCEIMPHATHRLLGYYDNLCEAMRDYGITKPAQEDMFLSALAWASGELVKLEEDGTGLPPEQRRYKGHGPFTITDYDAATAHFRARGDDVDFMENPGWLTRIEWVWRGACWRWTVLGCNHLAELNDWDGVREKLEIGEDAKSYLKKCQEVRYQRRPEAEVSTDEG